jgi:hypothetical protein
MIGETMPMVDSSMANIRRSRLHPLSAAAPFGHLRKICKEAKKKSRKKPPMSIIAGKLEGTSCAVKTLRKTVTRRKRKTDRRKLGIP